MTTDTTSRLTLLAPPEDEPLTVAEAKAFLRIEHDDEDAVIVAAIAAARASAEEYLRVLLLPQTYSYEFEELTHIVKLPVGPARSVEQFDSYDRNGNATAIDAGKYRLTIDGHGLVLPNIPKGHSFAVEFIAGLVANAEDVPAPIKQGMLHHIAAMLENRHGTTALPAQSVHLYQPYRRVRL